MFDLIVQSANVLHPDGTIASSDIGLKNGKIERVASEITADASEIIDAQAGKLILLIKDRRFVEKKISIDEELKKAINNEMNKQLNQYSIIYFKKIELNSEINEN